MQLTNMTLSIRNRFLQTNVIALGRFWRKIYKATRPGENFDLAMAKQYELCADGLEAVHEMLLHSRSNFRTERGATRACYNMVFNELIHIGRSEKPGLEAALGIFEKRLEKK